MPIPEEGPRFQDLQCFILLWKQSRSLDLRKCRARESITSDRVRIDKSLGPLSPLMMEASLTVCEITAKWFCWPHYSECPSQLSILAFVTSSVRHWYFSGFSLKFILKYDKLKKIAETLKVYFYLIIIIKEKSFIILIIFHVFGYFACMCIGAFLVPVEYKREHHIPWDWR